ncbi:hypothetical protein FHS57_003730 [Runella defluvii]|uniref:Uncharacterized protein n=1 Tax=Runella defluvii TaxID=370973 RepID=A0A7W5ZMQ1_9BACT|nr:hypothetical protein [Runella defluvii]MBB3839721.1 hypothetical protein [Runella defluvii]
MFARNNLLILFFLWFVLTAPVTYAGNDLTTTSGGENQRKTMLALEAALNKSLSVPNAVEMVNVLSPTQIPTADLTQEAKEAKALFEELERQNKVLTQFKNNPLQSLPVAIPLDGTGQGYLALKKAVFYPTHVELEVYARLYLGDEELYFGNKKVNYVPGSGFAGNASLALLGTQEFSNAQYKLSLTGGTAANLPNANATQLKINCGAFEALVLKGKFEFNKESFLKLDAKGYPMAEGTVVTSGIDIQVTNLSSLTVKLKDPLAFTLKKSVTTMGFLLSEAFFDFSEKNTPTVISAQVGMFLGSSTVLINQWTGLYTVNSRVYLPQFFIPATPSNPTPERPSFSSSVFLMDASGIYMKVVGSNVANFKQLGGSPMSIDQISFEIKKSNYTSFALSGKIGVPIAKNPFKKNSPTYDLATASPEEYITYTGSIDDKSQNFALKVKKQDNLYFVGAKSALREDSKVEFVEDSPTYVNNRRATTGGATDTEGTGSDELEEIKDTSGLRTGSHRLQARLVTPKLNFRYVIGLDVQGKQVSHDTASLKNVLSLGVILVEDLVVGYSFLAKRPIFKFTRMGYERLGNAPVFGKIGLKRLMAYYSDADKQCTVNFTFYANHNPVSKQVVYDAIPDTTSGLNITAGVDIVFDWEVSDRQTSEVDFKANFKSISLSILQLKTGDDMGFTLDGTLAYDHNDEEFGTVCRGNITAEFKIKGLKKLATGKQVAPAMPAEDRESPRMTVNWVGGRIEKPADGGKAFSFTYFDFLLSFGEGGAVIGPNSVVNGFGAGFAANMTQTNEVGSRYSLTGKKYIPRRATGGGLIAVTFASLEKTQRGFIGVYVEGAKASDRESAGGFRKLSIFGTWEFARDKVTLEPIDAKGALTAAKIPNSTTSSPTTAPNPTVQKNLTSAQINNAVKMLDVPLDDKFAIFKFDLTFDCTTDDFIMEGNVYGFMHAPLKTDTTGKSTDGNRSYVRGAADSQGAGFLGMVSFKLIVKNLIGENKENKENKKNGLDKKNEPNPVNGYLWIGRPDQPLAIEININLGKEESPTYLKIGATFYVVGGNVPLPSNKVVYTPIVENAKSQINNELIARGQRPIYFDLPTSVTMDGTSYFSLGLSLGGSVYLSTPTKAVSVYANLTLGLGFMVAYDKNFLSCNESHWLGSGVFHGSGDLGIVLNIKKTQTKFEILKGAITAGGVFDFKGSYGAMTFEYSLLGGIVEGKAFMKFGDSPCLAGNETYDLNSRVNLVQGTSPSAEIIRSEETSTASAHYTELMIQRHEMIILKMDPAVPVYEWCNLRVNGQVIENVFIAANYYSYGSGLKRFVHQQPNNQIRFVSNNADYDMDSRKLYKKWTALHNPNVDLTLVAELVITEGNQAPDTAWIPIEGTDFKQTFTFRTRTWNSFNDWEATKIKGSDRWHYIRNP